MKLSTPNRFLSKNLVFPSNILYLCTYRSCWFYLPADNTIIHTTITHYDMKKTLSFVFTLLALSIILSCATSCSPKKKEILGTWHTTVTSQDADEEIEVNVTSDITSTYNDDGTSTSTLLFTENTVWGAGEMEGVAYTAQYKVDISYTWTMFGNKITESPQNVEVTFLSLESNVDDYEFEQELIKNYKKNITNPSLKQDFYAEERYTLVNVTPGKLVVKDDEGSITEFTR